ncbi:putative receptor protein kinase ZmPK1 [Arachis hypogaea]|uniref:putative receptor protein kinase ZmPK1 n=1 Tax=Arachis hypogaea TaxID=3818 RepID=UPI0010FC518F|nr:putative receptor protein kinase ZmPK1 [Arachis hypogaea]
MRFDLKKGRKCSCVPGYKVKNQSDWSYGCESIFAATSNERKVTFLELGQVEFYGYDAYYLPNFTYTHCESLCLNNSNCKGFQYSYDNGASLFKCYTKTQLLNRHFPGAAGTITYLKVPKGKSFPTSYEDSVIRNSDCSVKIHREYSKKHVSHFVSFLLWFATAIGVLEMACVFVVLFLIKSKQNSSIDPHGHHLATVGFRKFSYSELKKATKEFSQEIRRGAGGIVYKAILSNQRIAAIKKLNNAMQGEGEFLAEVSIIGRLNHMNLIEMWGYCAEGKHRLLVYEYMENGSLADNLSSNTLDQSKRYNIALKTARGLEYLHEECLERILHCDIKPQNILLDSNYQPKVADFGLSKLLNRDVLNNDRNFSMIRETRGYMAPEWVFKLAIIRAKGEEPGIKGKSTNMGYKIMDKTMFLLNTRRLKHGFCSVLLCRALRQSLARRRQKQVARWQKQGAAAEVGRGGGSRLQRWRRRVAAARICERDLQQRKRMRMAGIEIG